MKRIAYQGGIVSFSIPDDWVEEYEEEAGTTLFYEDKPGSGTLRLNVIAAREPNRPIDRSGTDRLRSLFDGTRQPNMVVRVLDNGNVLSTYTRQAFERGEELSMHYWEIANRMDENHIRLAIFSFTTSASRTSDKEILAQIAMLDEHLPQIRFWNS